MGDNVIEVRGPLFDGEAEKLLEEAVKTAQNQIANEALVQFQDLLDEHIRHNGGVYTGFVQKVDDGPDKVVNDGWGETNDLPYGLWLEGIGSRNAPVTVFEGYHSLEEAYLETEKFVDEITETVVNAYVDRINNG